MKTILIFVAVALVAFAAGYWWQRPGKESPSPQHLTLEQILSIKELHLVKHTYHDLFFLHKKNQSSKPIRAIVQVPVTITAYLNLKEIELIHEHDSIKAIVLPRAHLNTPIYEVDKMIVRETRSLQLHLGKDLYPLVGTYMKEKIAERMDTLRKTAYAYHIIEQAEAEGKEYVESLLKASNQAHVQVLLQSERSAAAPKATAHGKAVAVLAKKSHAMTNAAH